MQDLAASAVAKELEVDEVECGMCQGDKVRASAVGELFRAVNKENLLFFYSWSILMIQFKQYLFSLIITRKWQTHFPMETN